MKTRPWPLVLLAAFYLIAPALNLAMSAAILHVPLAKYFVHILRTDTAWGLISFFLLPPIAAVAIWVMKKWSYPVFFAVTLLLAFSNFQTWQAHPRQMSLSLLLVTYVINLALVGYFLLPAVRKVYADRRLRWWEAKPRFDMNFPALLSGDFGEKKSLLVDFSEGGAFVKCSSKLPSDSPLNVSFRVLGRDFRFDARIVHRRTHGAKGYGLQFRHTPDSLRQARSLAGILKRLDLESAGRRPGPESGFRHWFTRLMKTGQGWVPDVPAPEARTGGRARRNGKAKLAKVIPLGADRKKKAA
ncbi:MAG: PilZ domain-containing protein [Oligoflexia bacterium]|nr:PilZ domain-containing protein [Oligoflexia bacterium]